MGEYYLITMSQRSTRHPYDTSFYSYVTNTHPINEPSVFESEEQYTDRCLINSETITKKQYSGLVDVL